MSSVHPIEEESFRILDRRVDLSSLGPCSRAVVGRVIHASADTEYARSMVLDESELESAVVALRGGAPVVVDVAMVGAGITAVPTYCYLRQVPPGSMPTRSAAAMRLGAEAHPVGAVFVVGCAPTALAQLLTMAGAGVVTPALVIGMPVGFVGAAESKELLRASGLPAVSNIGERGGAAVAAAAANALLRLAGVRTGADGDVEDGAGGGCGGAGGGA